MSSFGAYLIGFLILIVGLGFAAYLLNVPDTWIAVGVIVLLGLCFLSATRKTKMRRSAGGTNPSSRPPTDPFA